MGMRHVARLKGLAFAMVGSAVLAGIGAFGGSTAWAQRIADETARSVTMSEPQKQEIGAYTRAHLGNLGGESPEAQQRARKALLEPLNISGVSVAFRIEYSEKVLGEVKQIIAKPGSAAEPGAINALRVVGELATAKSLETLAPALADERPAVRRAAAFGYERTFRAAGAGGPGGGAPALAATQVNAALDVLGERIATDDDPLVLDGVVLALDAAVHIGQVQQLEGVREQAVKVLSESTAKRLKGLNAGDATLDTAVARALDTLVRAQTDIQRPMPAAAHKSVSLLAGHVLARVRAQLQQQLVTDRESVEGVVRLAERAYIFAHRQMGGQPLELRLDELIRDSKDDQYIKKVIELIGPNGMLTSAPFGFADDEFVKE